MKDDGQMEELENEKYPLRRVALGSLKLSADLSIDPKKNERKKEKHRPKVSRASNFFLLLRSINVELDLVRRSADRTVGESLLCR